MKKGTKAQESQIMVSTGTHFKKTKKNTHKQKQNVIIIYARSAPRCAPGPPGVVGGQSCAGTAFGLQ